MRGLNKVQLIGNLGKDPEMRHTTGGKNVATCSLAVNETRDKTEWVNLVAWEKTADILTQYAHKGDPIYVEGRMQARTYEKDGQTRYMTEVVVYNLLLLGGNSKPEQPAQRRASKPMGSAGTMPSDEFDLDDSDLPF